MFYAATAENVILWSQWEIAEDSDLSELIQFIQLELIFLIPDLDFL